MRMERDFMGLRSKAESVVVVKEEVADAAPLESGSGVPWSFMNKGCTVPRLMPVQATQDDRTKKLASVQTSSAGFAPVNSASEMQRNSISKTDFTISAQSLVGATLKQQFFAGLSLALPSSGGQIVRVTEPWYNFKASGTHGQMTIFYGGNVSVYDDISPEKAQAIMLLAGNGSSTLFNQRPQLPAFGPKPVTAGDLVRSQALNSQPCTDHTHIVHSGSASNNSEEVGNKTSGVGTAAVGKPELQRVVSSLSPISLGTMVQSAIPQARKASLARFLEKRKERIMSITPYSCEKKPQESHFTGNNEASLSATSATTTGSASAGMEN